MHGPYRTKLVNGRKIIEFVGNRIDKKIEDVTNKRLTLAVLNSRLEQIGNNERYHHIHKIDSSIFFAATDYFRSIGADWCNLPLTTKMISSPGEVYAQKSIDYTTDALPVELRWFDQKRVYLAESAQFYLEICLLIKNTDKVFSIYNSFRKERADFSHLSEFQHIEFEGHVDFHENIKIAINLLQNITEYLCNHNRGNLSYFLNDQEIDYLTQAFSDKNFEVMSFAEALALLYKDTHNVAYKKFSLENFGAWEEIRLSEILNKHIILSQFPLMQIPFYHKAKLGTRRGVPLSESADLILCGYRETVGSGVRITDRGALFAKAKAFNLPMEDYRPYLKTRDMPCYKQTAGFGLGWQRFLQWLLKLPYIWEATIVPRGHLTPKP